MPIASKLTWSDEDPDVLRSPCCFLRPLNHERPAMMFERMEESALGLFLTSVGIPARVKNNLEHRTLSDAKSPLLLLASSLSEESLAAKTTGSSSSSPFFF
eukprot:TRINITY_DN69359_c0_g1_i1.p1 TRINITY_DN69359_c0_g1~~TRINITY_DN69359_c0_g1_i1.p1  ORF type:complete len:101 (-),score=13.74 TRINITY_DN69359_c0_g1_i1:25-327(-)